MGNCLISSSVKVDSTISSSGISEVGSKMSSSSPGPSSMTISTFRGGSSSIDRIPPSRSEGKMLSSPNLKAFSFLELKNATRNFCRDSLLGQGRYAYVFKGWIDEVTHLASKPGSGMAIAVKKLKPSPEGIQDHTEWLTEVTYLGQLHHPNIVKLIGYCTESDNRLLVYEFLPKGSLDNHLFGRGPQSLPWATRLKVAIGAARGLAFLHDAKDQVLYLEFKASNILLDAEFNAKLLDFGLAKARPIGDRVCGIKVHQYTAPEYVQTGHLTEKSDVYNFGVFLLELLTGRRAVDREKVGLEQKLVEWTKPHLGDKRYLVRIMDPKLEGQYPQKAVYTAARLALQCVTIDPKTRPRMSDVLASLEELQTAKYVPKDHQTVSNAAPKSPAGHRPRRLTPSASPFPTPRQSTPLK